MPNENPKMDISVMGILKLAGLIIPIVAAAGIVNAWVIDASIDSHSLEGIHPGAMSIEEGADLSKSLISAVLVSDTNKEKISDNGEDIQKLEGLVYSLSVSVEKLFTVVERNHDSN